MYTVAPATTAAVAEAVTTVVDVAAAAGAV